MMAKKKLIFYEREKPSGQSDGMGWHTKEGAKTLRKKGHKLKVYRGKY